MKSNYLFPNYFKKPAFVLFITSIIFGLYLLIVNDDPEWLRIPYENNNFIFSSDYLNLGITIQGTLLILSSIFLAFSKEKEEDEYIAKIRLESLVWATYINYGLLFLSFIFIFGVSFINVMIYNMYTLLIIFLIRFNYYKFKLTKSLKNEE